jgi:hypothetical protein
LGSSRSPTEGPIPEIREHAATHVETGRHYWENSERWHQLFQLVANLATVTGEKRDERLEGVACVFTREQLLRAAALLIEGGKLRAWSKGMPVAPTPRYEAPTAFEY